MNELTKDKVLEVFEYDAKNGKIYWKRREEDQFESYRSFKMFNGKFAGKEAGSLFHVGQLTYRRLKMDNKNFFIHTLIWIIENNERIEKIDHIDGNGLNNRISNLRNGHGSINNKNCRQYKNNTSNQTGVYYYKRNKKWGSLIVNQHERHFLGLHGSYDAACQARKEAERKYGFHENHGRSKRN